MGKICFDHNGKQFESVKEMCEYHGVNEVTYVSRLKRGCSLEECLSKKLLYKGSNRCKRCSDHEGKQFKSIQAMCDYHGVRRGTYQRRLKAGYSLEECLSSEPKGNGKPCLDHNGKQFESLKEMCRYHGVSVATYSTRLGRGYSLEECLSRGLIDKSTAYTDHKGNQFESVRLMCEYHGVNRSTYIER